MMSRPFPALAAVFLSAPLFAQFTPGNLVVSRVGDGSAALTSAAQARFLDEYTPAGVFVQTVALPTTVSGSQRRCTDSGTATSNGFITQSADGRYLLAAGYDAAPGTASVTGTTSTAVNRVIARIGLDGTVDTSTALTDAYSGNNFRGVTSVDGSSFWISGTGSGSTPGARYVANLGDSTSVQLSTTVTNLRCIDIYGGQLYCSSASGAFQGVSAVGTGLPVTAGQVITLLNGFPTATGPSSYDFFFADANTVYVADDRTNGSGGIQKWVQSGGTWSLAYTLAPGASTGCRGLSGYVIGGVATLFATTAVTSATVTTVVTVTDTGPGSPFTTLVTNATNTAIRDVQFVRTPANVINVGAGCPNSNGTPTVGTSGAPVTGNSSFAITAGNCGPATLVVFVLNTGAALVPGFPIPGTPPCVEVFVLPGVLDAAFSDLAGASSTPLPLPANALLGGAQVSAQVAAFDFSLVGFDLPIGTSDAVQITIGN
jgi:hypothetical protein